MHILQWYGDRDRGLVALRRAARSAIVMPIMFAIGDKVVDQPATATFAAFGSLALLLFVDFSGPMVERLQNEVLLGLVGAGLICLGTLASNRTWLATAGMVVVGFCILFAGVVSSVLAGASTSLLLCFILSVCLPGPASSIPDRLLGWGMAAAAALVAISVLWPTPTRDVLRVPSTTACRSLARRLRAQADLREKQDATAADAFETASEEASTAVATLRHTFLATPYRPSGLSTPARMIIRLVDELTWLEIILSYLPTTPDASGVGRAIGTLESAAADVLDRGADLLGELESDTARLVDARADLRRALDSTEHEATEELPWWQVEDESDANPAAQREHATQLVSSCNPSFRAHELGFAVLTIADNIELGRQASRRSWLERVLGRQPGGIASPLAAARERAAAHVDAHSVWLHNSVRGAIALGLAVFVATESGAHNAFWVVLGTLSVLRSNALNTGESLVRALLGTLVGFVIGALVLTALGTDTGLLWALLPFAVFAAGVAPAAISFTAGQAAFTITIIILFNIIVPEGVRVGLIRIEDVALGCAISGIVGLLFWPRGAAAAFGRALADAYETSAFYLTDAIRLGVAGGVSHPEPAAVPSAAESAAASRRLDDAFRTYLAERGPKALPLAQATGLVTSATALRLTGDAVIDLWQGDGGPRGHDHAQARGQLVRSSEQIRTWYGEFAANVARRAPVEAPIERDGRADSALVEALADDLREGEARASGTTVRIIWTADHLDSARRLQSRIIEFARFAVHPPEQRASLSR